MTTAWPMYLAGVASNGSAELPVRDKYTGEPIAVVARADRNEVERAITAAYASRKSLAELPAYRRRDVLNHCAARFDAQREELAGSLCAEAGKPTATHAARCSG